MSFYEIGKRIIDIIGAIIALIILSPLIIITSILIKISSKDGPVFAAIPKRVAKDKKEFKMYKFRSMIPHAHEWLKNNPEWYKKYQENNYKLEEHEDPRMLRIGSFELGRKIRKYSVDEIPQFINVLKGEMSIVGPRAYYPFELAEQQEKFPQTAQDIKTLLTVKPGITGPWQVGGRSNIGFVERVKMDAEYAKKKSLVYDLIIIFKTPIAVLKSKGAY